MLYIANHLSVWIAAITAFFFGWAWYGPVFGKKWMAMMGYTEGSVASMKIKPTTAMALGFISMLVMAYVVSMFVNIVGVIDFTGALGLTFWLWLGFIVTILAGSVLWEGRSVNLYLFNVAYQFISLLIITTIISLWV